MNIRSYQKRLLEVVKQAPVELFVAFCCWINLAWDLNLLNNQISYNFPTILLFIYAVNLELRSGRRRILYYVAFLIFPLFVWWNLNPNTSMFWLTLLISFLLLLAVGKDGKNSYLVTRTVNHARAFLFAYFLLFLAGGILLAILYTFVTLFNIDVSFEKIFRQQLYITYTLFYPILFLVIDQKWEMELEMGRISRVLFNYILTPGLLCYLLILYLYIGKIIFCWELPVGAVAYMCSCAIALILLLKTVESFFQTRYYNWFYTYFFFFLIPILIMLLIATNYRVLEYGFTERRIYLLVTVAMEIVCSAFLAFKPTFSYARLLFVIIISFSIFTYIPGISAKDLGTHAQMVRLNRVLNELPMATDESLEDQSKVLFSAFEYLQHVKGKDFMKVHYGFNNAEDLLYSTGKRVKWDKLKLKEKENSREVYVYLEMDSLNIAGYINWYNMSERLGNDDSKEFGTPAGTYYYRTTNTGQLKIFKHQELLFEVDLNQWFTARLAEVQLTDLDYLPAEMLKSRALHFMYIDNGDYRLIIRRITFNPKKKKIIRVTGPIVLLEK